MKKVGFIIGVVALAAMIVGCASTETGAYAPQNQDQFNYESTAKFVLMDKGAQNSVTLVEMKETTLEDGRLQVAANVRNRENRRIQVQANCEFKDAQGFAIDSTPWETLILTENGQETIQFASANDKAKRYTVRIREAR
jgi:uncharacterized protein YcfL